MNTQQATNNWTPAIHFEEAAPGVFSADIDAEQPTFTALADILPSIMMDTRVKFRMVVISFREIGPSCFQAEGPYTEIFTGIMERLRCFLAEHHVLVVFVTEKGAQAMRHFFKMQIASGCVKVIEPKLFDAAALHKLCQQVEETTIHAQQ